MTLLFSVVDPRNVTITCSEQHWQEHVLSSRPFMRGWEEDVKLTLKQPVSIYSDANSSKKQCYYRMHIKGNRYLKVVVRMKNDTEGEVITAYPTDSGKKGEILIWHP